MRQPALLLLALSYFLLNSSGYGFKIWLPKIVLKLSGMSTLNVSLVVMIPNLFATVAMLVAAARRASRVLDWAQGTRSG